MISTKNSVSLGKRIRKARMAKDIKQVELANLLGIKAQSLANYERGIRTPNLEMLQKISQYTDTPIQGFMDPIQGVEDVEIDKPVEMEEKYISRKEAAKILSKITKSDLVSDDVRAVLVDISYCVVTNDWGKKKAVT